MKQALEQPNARKHRLSATLPFALCAIFFAVFSQIAVAKTLCVNPQGSHGCYSKIQTAVNNASKNDVIHVDTGIYNEDVVIGIPLSLIGANDTVIDATNLANGVLVDGLDHPNLRNVTLAGFTVKNAQYEGVLVLSASNVTIRDNTIVDNDKFGSKFTGAASGCPGQPAYETDETGDCGGGLHLIGTADSTVYGNVLARNADGILISDETGESRGNVLSHNIVKDNPLECGIVLASHPPMGSSAPHFAPHYGVNNNTMSDNVSTGNGVQNGGAGIGLFSDGSGPGSVSENVIIRNTLNGNGIGGVSLHSHVGPAFGAPADHMNGNMIIGNFIAGNLADSNDTATPGRVGININSGGGGSPVLGTVISQNVITDEDVDIAVNTPAQVYVHLNNLLGGHVGVANICAFDKASICTGGIDATQNYWGCAAGPGWHGCSTASGADVLFTPWLESPITTKDDDNP